jgi:hypothetical protein
LDGYLGQVKPRGGAEISKKRNSLPNKSVVNVSL